MRKRSKPETVLQARIVAALEIAFPRYKVLRTNSGEIIVGNRRIRLMPKGFPDVLVLPPKRFPCGLEVKTEDGESSLEQLAWAAWFSAAGYPHSVVRSQQEALDFVARCM